MIQLCVYRRYKLPQETTHRRRALFSGGTKGAGAAIARRLAAAGAIVLVTARSQRAQQPGQLPGSHPVQP